MDQRDQGTEIMAKRTTGEPKDKLEKGREKQKANCNSVPCQNTAKELKKDLEKNSINKNSKYTLRIALLLYC